MPTYYDMGIGLGGQDVEHEMHYPHWWRSSAEQRLAAGLHDVGLRRISRVRIRAADFICAVFAGDEAHQSRRGAAACGALLSRPSLPVMAILLPAARREPAAAGLGAA